MGVPREEVERLYEEFGPALLAYARSIVHDAAEAEDALQQVFLKLIAGRGLGRSTPRWHTTPRWRRCGPLWPASTRRAAI